MSGSLFADSASRWKFGIAWLIWIMLHAWVLSLYGVGTTIAILDSLISNGILLLCILLAANAMQYYLPSKNQLGYISGLTGFTALVWFFATKSLLLLLPGSLADYDRFWNKAVPVRMSVGVLIILSSNLLNMFWLSLQRMQQEKHKLDSITHLSRQAELMKLRQQLQPHFLFNSLNSINALIAIDQSKARHMIHQLAEFFRNTIASERAEKQSLADELKHLALYLSIEKVRFGDRLHVEVLSNETAEALKLPTLLLQPLMENAIKYGLYDTIGDVHIRLEALANEKGLVITIANPFDAATNTLQKGTGFGLSSVAQRLFLLYGRQGLLETHAADNLFYTTVTIPQL